jgi:hypothetical protein
MGKSKQDEVKGKGVEGTAPAPPEEKTETRKSFVEGLLRGHPEGMTWKEIQAELVNKFGKAPKKRHCLYTILKKVGGEKRTGEKRIVTYALKPATAPAPAPVGAEALAPAAM